MKRITIAIIYFLALGSISQAEPTSAESLWKRPVVIGASVSDGYDRTEPIGGVKSEKLSLEHYLSKLIKAPHGKITNFGNKFYFIRPSGVSSKQVELALKLNPSVVLAPDFLFWMLYGNYGAEDKRLVALSNGLKLLDKFKCPTVVGNIPDASKAVYRMLSPSQIPKAETLVKANLKISEWAEKRSNIALLDNKLFMKKSHANEEIKLGKKIIPKGKTQRLLQSDFLHPTKEGAMAMSYALLECLRRHTKFPEKDVTW